MNLEFKAGQEVWIMKNNQPVSTRVRAVKYIEALEVSRDAKTGKETDNINVTCVYGTFADLHKPCTADQMGNTREELLQKSFGKSANENGGNQ